MRVLFVVLALAGCAQLQSASAPRNAPHLAAPRTTAARPAPPRPAATLSEIQGYCNLTRPVETAPADFLTHETQAEVDAHNGIYQRICGK